MQAKRPVKRGLNPEQSDLAVAFYDAAVDHPRETFAMIAKRVVPKGFGKTKTSAAFRREARKSFDLAHQP
jgi:hypothetical protein